MKARWSGTARVEVGEVTRVRFERSGDETIAWIGKRTFALETEEGRFKIDVSNDAVKILPEKKRSGTWETFESDPHAHPFVSMAPGPHVHVKLWAGTIRDGDHVVVDGSVDASDEKRVHARLVSVGDAAPPEVVAPKPTRARSISTSALIINALAITLALAAIAVPFSPATLDFAMFSAAMFATALQRRVRGLIVFRAALGRVDRAPWGGTASFIILFMGLVQGGLSIATDWPGRMLSDKPVNGSPMALVAWSIYFVCLLIDLVRSGRHSYRLSRVALMAPPLEVDRWGSVVGNIRSHEERAAMYSLIEESWTEGSGSNPRNESQHQSPFVIQVTESRVVRVVPHGKAWWATDAIEQSNVHASEAIKKTIIERAEIHRGAHVLAVGRSKLEGDDEVLAPTGPESLLLFASDEDDPRRVLRRRRALWMITLLAITTLAIASTVLAIVQPGMPAFNVPESD